MAHNATHVPFKDGCPICVVSRGRSSPHKRVVVNKTADTLPKFQTDYMFIPFEQWSGDQLHVRSERWLCGLDEGNLATF